MAVASGWPVPVVGMAGSRLMQAADARNEAASPANGSILASAKVAEPRGGPARERPMVSMAQ